MADNTFNSPSTGEFAPKATRLKDVLINATLDSPNRVPEGVDAIDIAGYADDFAAVWNATDADIPRHREHGIAVYATNHRTLLVPREPTVGSEAEFAILPDVKIRGAAVIAGEIVPLQERYLALLMHSHPSGRPFSVTDILLLFTDNDITDTTSVGVTTSQRVMLAFRGETTPEWSEDKRRVNEKAWTEEIHRMAAKNLGGVALHDRSDPRIFGAYESAQRVFLRQMQERYGIQIFSGKVGQQLLTPWNG